MPLDVYPSRHDAEAQLHSERLEVGDAAVCEAACSLSKSFDVQASK
jgi:hypothetical protein